MAKLVVTATYSNKAAPLKAHEQTVMVKVTAPVTAKKDTAPLDVVLVLDTSGSMAGDKISKMKAAMEKILEKLGRRDRLAIVPFSSEAVESKARPQYTSTQVKADSNAFIHKLKAEGKTNIRAGLQVAVKVLLDRFTDKQGRTGVIFLMSDGKQNHGDAGKVDVSEVNVQTFGFGEKHDSKVRYMQLCSTT
ncbi:uncharacterized protein LOC112268554 [Brachypodium distachyon]|uniref:VWFA domain-containing protein n=1 Tax=Brachypodium distachyon TaxID=15368 RepID=A0A2K2DS50_BRADI|nr:uncharacterized protein LOC112268554 [Brachypodium distachyon]PNT77105.1 hypothetical protein BRADI_1g57846v3 [Brachypodium distachyon]|eukprot:XP_024313440.1 uncharacterized protein LOC112268554 [Brachypodium distachyon]